MGDLSLARVISEAPFFKSGVDYAGPVSVRLSKTRGRGTLKGYIAIFVCMSTRAVHLEIVEDYSSQYSHLYSDNGTNFVGADRQLREMFAQSSAHLNQISQALIHSCTSWHFILPASPHFGGLWEAAVKSTKRHLHRIIGEQILTFIEYSTLLCRIEAYLNSRRFIPLSDDASELQRLTPAHFLIQRCSFLVPQPDFSTAKISLSKRWDF